LIYYLDSSVIVELIKVNTKSNVFLSQLDGPLFTSRLGRVETIRTVTKLDSSWIDRAKDFLEVISLVELREEILARVESYGSEISLKTSDAIHIATAQLLFRDDEGVLVTRDKQMALNAEKLGIKTISA
jgi:predicted nucleic acid-binding protein